MQLLIKKCDRCGAAIEEIDYKNELENARTPVISFFDGKEDIKYDICDSCACQFLDYMNNSAIAIQQSVERVLSLSERQEFPATIPKIDKSKIKLKPGTHTYHIWTKEEDDFILHHSAGMTSNDLACKFGVTVGAINSRRYNLLHGKA